MDCPFKTPAKYELKITSTEYIVVDAERKVIAKCSYENDALFIQKAINSHEKLKDIIFEVARHAIAKYDVNAPPLTKNRFANEFVDSLEQALKEAGEPK